MNKDLMLRVSSKKNLARVNQGGLGSAPSKPSSSRTSGLKAKISEIIMLKYVCMRQSVSLGSTMICVVTSIIYMLCSVVQQIPIHTFISSISNCRDGGCCVGFCCNSQCFKSKIQWNCCKTCLIISWSKHCGSTRSFLSFILTMDTNKKYTEM